MKSKEFSRFKKFRANSKMSNKFIKLLKNNKAKYQRRALKQVLLSRSSSFDFNYIVEPRDKDNCRNLL